VDNNKVYYRYWNEGMGIETRSFEIIGADAKRFKVLEIENYAIDKNLAYYKGEPVLNSDSSTFESLLDYYAKDNNKAYYEKSVIEGANGKAFEIINEGPYSRDGKDYFFDSIKLNVFDYN
jgi:hypothetical protein